MKRDIQTLAEESFDILIVGGGVYGATAAWDAASRGFKTALIEKGDFGGATSANSLKIVHGGLRYLQQLDIQRMRESILERRWMLRTAPHLVHPLKCVMPTYGHLMKGPEAMRVGLWMNDIISHDRNRVVDRKKFIPPGRVISKKACLEMLPGVDPAGINGGAMWTDAQMINSDRLILAFVQSAVNEGACAANYVKAVKFLHEHHHVTGVKAEEVATGESFDIRSKMVVNLTGAWTESLLREMDGKRQAKPLSTAMNLVLKRQLLPDCAAGVYGHYKYPLEDGRFHEGRRVLFMTPWRNHTIVGTYHRPYQGDPDDLHVTEPEIEDFLAEINSAYPVEPVYREDVCLVHKGFLPMEGVHPKTGDVMLTKQYQIVDHRKTSGLEGMISAVGVKYTTARDVSEKMIDLAARRLGERTKHNVTKKRRIFGGEIDLLHTYMGQASVHPPDGLTPYIMEHLVCQYGSGYHEVSKLCEGAPSLAEPLMQGCDVIAAELIYAARHEMAMTLSDAVLRRTELGSGGYPGETAIKRCADLMGGELGWKPAEKKAQIDALHAHYQKMGALS